MESDLAAKRDLIRRITATCRERRLKTYDQISKFIELDRQDVANLLTGQSDNLYSTAQLEEFLEILEAVPTMPDHIRWECRSLLMSGLISSFAVISCIVACYLVLPEMIPLLIMAIFLASCYAATQTTIWCMFYLEYKWRDLGPDTPAGMEDSRAAFLIRKLCSELVDCAFFAGFGVIIAGSAYLSVRYLAGPLWIFLAGFFAFTVGIGLVTASAVMGAIFLRGFRRDHRDGHFPR